MQYRRVVFLKLTKDDVISKTSYTSGKAILAQLLFSLIP